MYILSAEMSKGLCSPCLGGPRDQAKAPFRSSGESCTEEEEEEEESSNGGTEFSDKWIVKNSDFQTKKEKEQKQKKNDEWRAARSSIAL